MISPLVSQRRGARAAMLFVALALLACHGGESVAPVDGGPALRILSGGDARDTISGTPVVPLIVEAIGADGGPMAGVTVEFRSERLEQPGTTPPVMLAAAPQGFMQAALLDTTDSKGRATAFLRMTGRAGAGTITVKVASAGLQVSTPVMTLPGAPVRISLAPRDTPVYASAEFSMRAAVVDRAGNTVSTDVTFSGVSNNLSVSSAGVVHASVVGRGRFTVQGGGLTDSAFVSVVPRGIIAVLDRGQFVGDSLGFAQQELDGSAHRWIALTGTTPQEWSPSNGPSPRWIPGTPRLVYSRVENGATRLFVGDSTRAARRLTVASFAATSERDPDVTADGAWVYFVANDADGHRAVWRVQPDSGVPELVFRPADLIEISGLALSPDGTQLAYAAPTGAGGTMVLMIRTLATGATRQLGTTEATGVRWSPTGEWILYGQSAPYAGYSGPQHLVHPDGSGDHVLNNFAYSPGGAWTPDGKWLLLERAFTGYGYAGPELFELATGLELPLVYATTRVGAAFRR